MGVDEVDGADEVVVRNDMGRARVVDRHGGGHHHGRGGCERNGEAWVLVQANDCVEILI